MPTYDYRCPNGHDFEKFFRTISASEPTVVCPVCGLMGARQVSAGAGLLFKGSGFYLTDYGKNAHANRGNAKPSPAGEKGGKAESTGDGSTVSGESAKKSREAASGSAAGGSGRESSGGSSGETKSTPKKGD